LRQQGATVHELSRVAELAVLPGETLAKLAREMERRDLAPGEELDPGDRFAVVLNGMLSGRPGIARPGDRVSAPAHALTPAAVATCELAVYEEIVAADG
jgi:hypothetical protein